MRATACQPPQRVKTKVHATKRGPTRYSTTAARSLPARTSQVHGSNHAAALGLCYSPPAGRTQHTVWPAPAHHQQGMPLTSSACRTPPLVMPAGLHMRQTGTPASCPHLATPRVTAHTPACTQYRGLITPAKTHKHAQVPSPTASRTSEITPTRPAAPYPTPLQTVHSSELVTPTSARTVVARACYSGQEMPHERS